VYLKTKQLHPSQQIAYEDDSSVEVAIKVYPSQDFIMMLLSYGSKVQVISPLWLAKKVEDEHIKAAKSYKKRS
jgi:predicted DNA-binding transcriptional regulator YafY